MATEKNARQISEERAAAQGEVFNSFKDAGVGAVRSLELNNIFLMPISGTTNKAAKVITEEGKDFWIGCLTRGARPADGSDFVRPTGTVVDAVQKHATMDEAFKEELAGKKIKFETKFCNS